MDEIQFIPVEILRETYERKIADLIDTLLSLDEKLFQTENQEVPAHAGQTPNVPLLMGVAMKEAA